MLVLLNISTMRLHSLCNRTLSEIMCSVNDVLELSGELGIHNARVEWTVGWQSARHYRCS